MCVFCQEWGLKWNDAAGEYETIPDNKKDTEQEMGRWMRLKGRNVWVETATKLCCHKGDMYYCPHGPNCQYCEESRKYDLSPTISLGSPWASSDECENETPPSKEDTFLEKDDQEGTLDTSNESTEWWDESWDSWWTGVFHEFGWDEGLGMLDGEWVEKELQDHASAACAPAPEAPPSLRLNDVTPDALSENSSGLPPNLRSLVDFCAEKEWWGDRESIYTFLHGTHKFDDTYIDRMVEEGMEHPGQKQFSAWLNEVYGIPDEWQYTFGKPQGDRLEDLADLVLYLVNVGDDVDDWPYTDGMPDSRVLPFRCF
jgi:hypothetical protein